MPDEPANHGVVLGQRADDYIAGASPIPYEVRVENGNWAKYLPPGEYQSNPPIDTQACVTFSALNSIECQYEFLTGEKRNFSDRFTAVMSGTTTQGNYLWKVADSIRRDGLVDEALWPWQGPLTWEQYYLFPPTQVIDIGRLFLLEWDVRYEWVTVTPENIRYHLKHAPLQVVIPGHAVVHHFRNESDIKKYFDSYAPFIKTHPTEFLSAMKIVLTKRNNMTEQQVKWLYALAFYRAPTEVPLPGQPQSELAYWTGKPLEEFLRTAINDRSVFLDGQTPEPNPIP